MSTDCTVQRSIDLRLSLCSAVDIHYYDADDKYDNGFVFYCDHKTSSYLTQLLKILTDHQITQLKIETA